MQKGDNMLTQNNVAKLLIELAFVAGPTKTLLLAFSLFLVVVGFLIMSIHRRVRKLQ